MGKTNLFILFVVWTFVRVKPFGKFEILTKRDTAETNKIIIKHVCRRTNYTIQSVEHINKCVIHIKQCNK